MNLKAIREALKWARTQSEGFGFGPHPLIDKALAEADEAEKALREAINEALEEAIQAIDAAFANDQDVTAQDVIRALKKGA